MTGDGAWATTEFDPRDPSPVTRSSPCTSAMSGGCCRSTSAARARSSGRARPSARRSGRSRSTAPRMVRRINIDGDDQADRRAHGGEHRAVFVYQIESYRYWERELGRDDFSYGQFGENFTVEGLADDEVCIGDRYRIGGALFEVTQPRVTCYRVGIRMDDPAMPSLLVAHHRPGFYFRVIEEGPVQAGDAIEKVADGPGAADDRARSTGCSTCPDKSRDAARARAARPRAERGLEGQLPRAAGRQDGGAAAARVGGLPAAARRGGAARERDGHARSGSCRGGRRGGGRAAAGQYLTLRLRRTRRPAADPQLLAVGPARRARLPDQRQARRRGQPLPARARQGRRRDRRRRAARELRPARRRRARSCWSARASARRRCSPCCTRWRATQHARPVWWLHGARNRDEHAFARRGRRAARRAAGRAPARRLQPARRPDDRAPTTTTSAGSTSRCSTAPASPPTPTTTCAGRTASCARSARR